MSDLLSRLRRYLITGLIVVAPVGVTIWVLVWLFQRLDSLLGRYLPGIEGYRLPGLGLLALVLVLLFFGWMAQWAMGRKLVGWWNSLLSRLPLTRRIYNATSQIAQTVLARKEKFFQRCVLVEFPHPGSYSVGFVTARAADELEEATGSDAVNVFLPTSPNPTTGYLLVLPVERVRKIDMTVDEAMKMVVSFGAVVPGEEARRARGLDLDRLLGPSPAGRERPGGRRRWGSPFGERQAEEEPRAAGSEGGAEDGDGRDGDGAGDERGGEAGDGDEGGAGERRQGGPERERGDEGGREPGKEMP